MSSSAAQQNIDYSSLNAEQIAEMVKNARIAKGYTQKELSDLAGINLRSIQRIENANVKPRSYTMKQLGKFLLFEIIDTAPTDKSEKSTLRRKAILSVGLAVLLIVVLMAFLAQSASFPETTFELLILITAVITFYMLVLLRIWR